MSQEETVNEKNEETEESQEIQEEKEFKEEIEKLNRQIDEEEEKDEKYVESLSQETRDIVIPILKKLKAARDTFFTKDSEMIKEAAKEISEIPGIHKDKVAWIMFRCGQEINWGVSKNYIYDQLGPEYKNIAKSISSRRVRRRMSRHGWDQKLKRFVSVDDYNPDKIPSYAHTTTIRLAQGLDRKLTLLNEKYEKARDEAAEWKNLYQNLELKYNALKKQLYDAVDSKS